MTVDGSRSKGKMPGFLGESPLPARPRDWDHPLEPSKGEGREERQPSLKWQMLRSKAKCDSLGFIYLQWTEMEERSKCQITHLIFFFKLPLHRSCMVATQPIIYPQVWNPHQARASGPWASREKCWGSSSPDVFPELPRELGGQELTSLNTALLGSLTAYGGETHQLSPRCGGTEG